jgi:isoleucyl-tRNA synthetase
LHNRAAKVLSTFKGGVLEGSTYTHPIYGRSSPVVVGGDYITTDSGTGLVHTAPGHGQEDYLVGSVDGQLPQQCHIASTATDWGSGGGVSSGGG